MVKISLIGCTGSIGEQVLRVVRSYPERFSVCALAANRRSERAEALLEEFRPQCAYFASEGGTMPEELFSECDVAFIAASGFCGLGYTLAAIRAGKKVALANKESLVVGGALVTEALERGHAELIPVDSEHSAIFQALGMRRDAKFEKLILTASGGPFSRLSEEELKGVTPAEALRHPTWKMGPKITVDSATLLNKGYEVIEAKWLYGVDFSAIETVMHPESIVHSLVAFRDGAMLAQLGYPDMRIPIQLALTCPDRLPCAPQLDLAKVGTLHFSPLPVERFPCFELALEAGKRGGTAPAVLNGAAEEAVCAFLREEISFPRIAETIAHALDRIPVGRGEEYGELEEADRAARIAAKEFIYG